MCDLFLTVPMGLSQSSPDAPKKQSSTTAQSSSAQQSGITHVDASHVIVQTHACKPRPSYDDEEEQHHKAPTVSGLNLLMFIID